MSDFYVCPNHTATGGWESCCECGGWDEDAERGRLCTEAIDAGHQDEGTRRVNVRSFSELSAGLRRRLADRDAERQRIWKAITEWTEVAHGLTEFKPLAPFFDELHAMVFPDEYLTDDEVREGGGA